MKFCVITHQLIYFEIIYYLYLSNFRLNLNYILILLLYLILT